MRLALFSFVVAALSVQQAFSLPQALVPSSPEYGTIILALMLEQLEVAYYTLGLEMFNESDFMESGFDALVFQRYQEILEHEQTHAATWTAVLGDNAPLPCNYSFPITNVVDFVSLSEVIEGVGSSAYSGAMQNLVTPEILTLAAAILATEARQVSWVDSSVTNNVPWGGPFETPINPVEAVTLAAQFIVSCPPTNPSLGISPLPSLNLTGTFIPGQNLSVQSCQDNATFIAFSTGLLTKIAPIVDGQVLVPQNLSGQVYALATSSGTEVTPNTIVCGPEVVLFELNSNGNLTN